MYILFYGLAFAFLWLPTLLHRTKIINKKNMPKKGTKCIVASNHYSIWDAMLFHVHFGRRYRALAKKELYKNKLFTFVLKSLGGIPVDRDQITPSTYKETISALNKNKQVIIFPEGTRNKSDNDELQGAKTGLVLFASKGDAPIVPVVIYRKPRFFRKNYMIVGEPFKVVGENPKRLTKEEIDLNVQNYVKVMADLRKQLDEIVQSKNKKKNK